MNRQLFLVTAPPHDYNSHFSQLCKRSCQQVSHQLKVSLPSYWLCKVLWHKIHLDSNLSKDCLKYCSVHLSMLFNFFYLILTCSSIFSYFPQDNIPQDEVISLPAFPVVISKNPCPYSFSHSSKTKRKKKCVREEMREWMDCRKKMHGNLYVYTKTLRYRTKDLSLLTLRKLISLNISGYLYAK